MRKTWRGTVFGLVFLAVSAAHGTSTPVNGAAPAIRWIDQQAAIDDLPVPNPCAPGATAGCVQQDTQIEPTIAINPENPLNAVAVFQEGRRFNGGAADTGYAVTSDGGATWAHGHFAFTKAAGGPSTSASDPWVAYGMGNIVYASASPVQTRAGQGAAVVSSLDGGRTWGAVHVADNGHCDDRNVIVVDTATGPGHHTGRLYMACNTIVATIGNGGIMVTYSDDGGVTWHPQPDVSGTGLVSGTITGPGAWPTGIRVTKTGDLWVLDRDLLGSSVPHDIGATIPDLIHLLVYPGAGSVTSGAPIPGSTAQPVELDLEAPVRQIRDNDSPQMATTRPTAALRFAGRTEGSDPTAWVTLSVRSPRMGSRGACRSGLTPASPGMGSITGMRPLPSIRAA